MCEAGVETDEKTLQCVYYLKDHCISEDISLAAGDVWTLELARLVADCARDRDPSLAAQLVRRSHKAPNPAPVPDPWAFIPRHRHPGAAGAP